VASCIGKEVSWTPEITLEDYKQADRQLERQEARRGFTIHTRIEQRAAASKRAA
jgi:hypothetical protein